MLFFNSWTSYRCLIYLLLILLFITIFIIKIFTSCSVINHLNSASNSSFWLTNYSSCNFNLSSSSIFSNSVDCFELISSLIICTFDEYILFRSSLDSNSYFLIINYYLRLSCYYKFFFSISWREVSYDCFYAIRLLYWIYSSILPRSMLMSYLSRD